MDRRCGDDAAILITSGRTFIFAGDHRQGSVVGSCDPVQTGKIGFVDFLVRIDSEYLHFIIRIQYEDAVSLLQLLQECERTGLCSVQMVVSCDDGGTAAR